MTGIPSLFDDAPPEVREALTTARKLVEVWFGGADPDDLAAQLDGQLRDIGVPDEA